MTALNVVPAKLTSSSGSRATRSSPPLSGWASPGLPGILSRLIY